MNFQEQPESIQKLPIGVYGRSLRPLIYEFHQSSEQGRGSLPRPANKFDTLRNESEVIHSGVIQCRVNLKI